MDSAPRSVNVYIIRIRGSSACFAQRFLAQQIGCPFGAAVMHKFDWLSPAALGKEHNGAAVLLSQVESQLGNCTQKCVKPCLYCGEPVDDERSYVREVW